MYKWIFSITIVAALSLSAPAQDDPASDDTGPRGVGPVAEPADAPPGEAGDIGQRDTLTGDWFSLGRRLQETGITVNLGLTQIYQQNLSGGLSTDTQRDHYTGSYDLEIEADMETLLGLPGGTLYAHAEGSWNEGIDPFSIGSAVGGVNDDAAGDRSIDLVELWYQQSLLDGRLLIRLGKLDITGGFEAHGAPVAFDANAYANDETLQFLNSALVNNPTIPFPDDALGVVIHAEPIDGWYASIGAADAQADPRETGFNTAFHDEDYFFAVAETGVVPTFNAGWGELSGAYRAGLWYDPQPKTDFTSGRTKRDDVGFYVSIDQQLLRENADDDQGLGVFARYGWADSDVNEITCFWSVGCQYQGLIPTRDQDVLGFGVARGKLVGSAGFSKQYETAYELYYGAWLAPWIQVAPSLQYIQDPGAAAGVSDAFVFGLRVQMAF